MTGPAPLDLTGHRYHRLEVLALERVGRPHWVCRCDCGQLAVVSTAALRSGNTRSCGCARVKIDITGQRFGRLLVLGMSQTKTGTQHARRPWRCLCECGTEALVLSWDLRKGSTQSCGCLMRERRAEVLRQNARARSRAARP